MQDVGYHEWDHPLENGSQGDVGHAPEDKYVHSHGGCDETHLHDPDHEDPVPDGIITKGEDHGEEDREGQKYRSVDIQEHSEDDV